MPRLAFTPRLLPLVLALGAALPAAAQNLVDLYTAARGYDASFQAARQQFDATLARADQARAGILPTLGLNIGASQTNQSLNLPGAAAEAEVAPQFSPQYSTENATLAASQPLYRPANWASYEQGKQQLLLAQAQLQQAEQDLIVRVSQAYFDVLAARDALQVVQTQKTAIAEQLASAKRNFEVGTATITDTRDAQARFDLVVAQELAAQNELRVKSVTLDQLVGSANAQPKPLREPATLSPLQPGDVEQWVQQAQSAHPLVTQAQVALQVAKLETQKAEAGNKPTVDLTAQFTRVNNIDGNASLPFSFLANQSVVGITLNMPLFAGYAIQNRVKETLALQAKAETDLENARRNVTLGTRTAFLGVLSQQAQVQALQAAQASSQSALESNQLGYKVGVRVNIDVLNAQSQLYDTQAKLAKARYDVLVGELRLRQASGRLQAQDLQAINAQLAP